MESKTSNDTREVTVKLESGAVNTVDTNGELCNHGKLCRWLGMDYGFDKCTLFNELVHQHIMGKKVGKIDRLDVCKQAEARFAGKLPMEGGHGR
jgi:hypothetical protein